MNTEVDSALEEMDVLVMITDEFNKIGPGDEFIIEKIKGVKAKKILIINKIDMFDQEAAIRMAASFGKYDVFDDILPMSALKNLGVDSLIKLIIKYLKPGPMYFPQDYITDRPERFVVAEIIREKALWHLQEEIPHGIAVEIEQFEQKEKIIKIDALIICEKPSHKNIIIGKKGEMLRTIGTSARLEMETLLQNKVHLNLFVKVKPSWRNKISQINAFGYDENDL